MEIKKPTYSITLFNHRPPLTNTEKGLSEERARREIDEAVKKLFVGDILGLYLAIEEG